MWNGLASWIPEASSAICWVGCIAKAVLYSRICRLQVQFEWLYISASFKTYSVQTLWSWELQQTFKSLIEKGEKCEEKPRKLEKMGHWAIAEFNSKTFGSNLMRIKVKFHPPLSLLADLHHFCKF